MFQLNKISQLLTVSADTPLSEIKKGLMQEGLYLGYSPLDEIDASIEHFLKRRISNLYYYKYGSLADVVSSMIVELKNGKSFHLKDAPRAAMGPDFNRMVIGSKDNFGQIKAVTLKAITLPEKIVHGIIFLPGKTEARSLLLFLLHNFICPLYFRHFEGDDCEKIFEALLSKRKPEHPEKSKHAAQNSLSGEALVFCLSGLSERVHAEQEVLSEHLEQFDYELLWLDNKEQREFVQSCLHNPESYRVIKEQYRQFFWTASDNAEQTLWEKTFLESAKSPEARNTNYPSP